MEKMRKKLAPNILNILMVIHLTALPVFSLDEPDQNKNFNPKPASASVYNLGLKSYEQGDLESAISFFKQATDLDPKFVDAYYNLGAIYKKEKKYYSAINALQRAVDINSDDLEIIYELASCYMEVKNYQKAKQYFSVIPQNFPKYTEVAKNLERIKYQVALENPSQVGEPNQISNEQFQAQLLADTLTKKEVPNNNEVIVNQPQPQQAQQKAQLLANTLIQPSREAFKQKIRTVSTNFVGPTGIAKDSKNNLYIANFANDTIEKVTPGGVREIFATKNGISGPVGLAVDENDTVYVANYNNNSIVRITQDRQVSVIVSKIVKPYYLFYDNNTSKLFVTAQGNDSLVEIEPRNISQPVSYR